MKKEQLQEVVTNILYYLQTKISKGATLQEAIQKVQESQDIFDDIEYQALSVTETLEKLKESYKDIALESLESYKESNKEFQNIANKHQSSFQEIQQKDGHINLDLIQEKFADIQEHLVKEIKRANDEIARLSEKVTLLEEESNIDALTKIFNRRALEKYLETICKKGSLKHELHLIILDIDDFKKINDKYGHIAGDKILIFIAQTLKKMLRDGDKVFRYGGEEFVIILNRITTQNCKTIAQRILQTISKNHLIYKNNTIKVTVSMGATKFQNNDTPTSLLERADKALYEAKKGGKNRFISIG